MDEVSDKHFLEMPPSEAKKIVQKNYNSELIEKEKEFHEFLLKYMEGFEKKGKYCEPIYGLGQNIDDPNNAFLFFKRPKFLYTKEYEQIWEMLYLLEQDTENNLITFDPSVIHNLVVDFIPIIFSNTRYTKSKTDNDLNKMKYLYHESLKKSPAFISEEIKFENDIIDKKLEEEKDEEKRRIIFSENMDVINKVVFHNHKVVICYEILFDFFSSYKGAFTIFSKELLAFINSSQNQLHIPFIRRIATFKIKILQFCDEYEEYNNSPEDLEEHISNFVINLYFCTYLDFLNESFNALMQSKAHDKASISFDKASFINSSLIYNINIKNNIDLYKRSINEQIKADEEKKAYLAAAAERGRAKPKEETGPSAFQIQYQLNQSKYDKAFNSYKEAFIVELERMYLADGKFGFKAQKFKNMLNANPKDITDGVFKIQIFLQKNKKCSFNILDSEEMQIILKKCEEMEKFTFPEVKKEKIKSTGEISDEYKQKENNDAENEEDNLEKYAEASTENIIAWLKEEWNDEGRKIKEKDLQDLAKGLEENPNEVKRLFRKLKRGHSIAKNSFTNQRIMPLAYRLSRTNRFVVYPYETEIEMKLYIDDHDRYEADLQAKSV